jgi:competence protein ComEA
MFGRRGSADKELAVIAQRRLAALARQFEAARAGAGLAEQERVDDEDPPSDSLSSVPRSEEASPVLPTGGRHAAPRQFVRWRLTPHQVTVATLVVVAAVLVAAWWVLRSVPDPEPVQFSREHRTPGLSPTDAGSGVSSASTPTDGAPDTTDPARAAVVVVDVAGRVRDPGIVELPAGSRVVDAIKAAGGVARRVDTSGLNLARVLTDGEQVVVGLRVPAVPGGTAGSSPGGAASGTATAGPALASINLNTATQAELELLPGIGPVTAAAILQWRTDHGGFTVVDELLDVSGIGDATLAEVAPYVYV